MIRLRIVDPTRDTGDIEVVAGLGVFDGVHNGHQALLKEAVRLGRSLGRPVCAVTFHPHPKFLLSGSDAETRLLTPTEEKRELFSDLGLDLYWQIPFTRELAETEPLEFVRDYLVEALRVKHVVCGFNYTFGHKGQGRPADLVNWGNRYGFQVSVIPPYLSGGEVVSSTRIRRDLESGKMQDAWDCLGRPYCVFGTVIHGDGRGSRIGFPTANLEIQEDKVVPGNGVYGAFVRVQDDSSSRPIKMPGVVNVGIRPTFGGKDVRVEVHIPGFSGRLYGQKMQVFLVSYLRDERTCSSVEALKIQVQRDVASVLSDHRLKARCGQNPSFTVPGAYDRML